MQLKLATGFIIALALTSGASLLGQSSADSAEAHIAAAKTAAGTEHTAVFNSLCAAPAPAPASAPAQQAPATPRQNPPGPPARSLWHAAPAKVFDNLYYLGQTEYSAWAVTTSDGIIIVDTLFDYSVEDEIINGLTTLGLDPYKIKYVLVSHAHTDHIGGAKYLQDHFGARIVMSKEDWDLADRSIPERIRPKRQIEAKDGDTLTLGDATIRMYITPGHTPGTVSSIYTVKDRGTTHTVATWGGTTIQGGKAETYLAYIASADRYKDIVKKAGADIVLSNHTAYDNTPANIRKLATRGATNPYVVGNAAVLRYITTAEECAKAGYLATTKLAGTSSR